ncbi:basic proline-rich protein-like [Aquila chrysaetos chrysaetos]|uniref:basic proline-rich protein-like n=1 Tax=Aquila chrysaetos chrysaetos TaxID=223781 RepID=UPI0011772B4A|nr:basic proline-rich protein-like [Aquila chrysaetos chrysaetos]
MSYCHKNTNKPDADPGHDRVPFFVINLAVSNAASLLDSTLSFHVPFSSSRASPALKARPYRPRPSLPRTRPEKPDRTPGRPPRPAPPPLSEAPPALRAQPEGGVTPRTDGKRGHRVNPPPTAFAAPRAQPPQASPEQRRARHVPSPPAGKKGGRCRFPPLRGQRCRPRSGAGPKPSPARPPTVRPRRPQRRPQARPRRRPRPPPKARKGGRMRLPRRAGPAGAGEPPCCARAGGRGEWVVT